MPSAMFPSRVRAWAFGLAWLALGAGGCAPLEPAALGPHPSSDDPKVDWLAEIERRVPPLVHPRGQRLPMILWNGVGFDPLPAEKIRALLDRGLVQHVRLDASSIPAAKALATEKAPVIVMDARGDIWPYNLVGDKSQWAHRYPEDAKDIKPEWRDRPSPNLLAGWAMAAEETRRTLRAFKAAGVTIDAVWLDNEGEPLGSSYGAALASAQTRATLPPEALRSPGHYAGFTRRLWMELMGSYIAAPVREIFPAAMVTNWEVMVSTPERPVLNWHGRPIPPIDPGMFTATNPTAYGIDLAFLAQWPPDAPRTRDLVDRFYTHLLLRQVSDDAANRARVAPWLKSAPWVARYVSIVKPKEGEAPAEIPMMSRAAYREVLRHLWLRGIDGMQVFNAPGAADVNMAIGEIEDAAAVYDEMLAFAPFLDGGEVMNTLYPGPREAGAVWSGLRLEDEAVVRLFAQGPFDAPVTIRPWPDCEVTLRAAAEGRTVRLRRDGGRCRSVDP